jgi:hypothetical protein
MNEIVVNGPNGEVRFPAGTDAATIDRVMREAAGGQQATPAQRPGQQFAAPAPQAHLSNDDWFRQTYGREPAPYDAVNVRDEAGDARMREDYAGWLAADTQQANQIQAGFANPDVAGNPNFRAHDDQGGRLRLMAQGATLGFWDEILGAVAGVGGAISGEGYRPAYDRTVERERNEIDLFRTQNPGTATTMELLGGTATMAVPGAYAARGGTAAQQIRRGAATGAGVNATYAYGSNDGTPQERLMAMPDAALMGGVLGAAAPAVLSGARSIAGIIQPQANAQRSIQTALAQSNQTPGGIAQQLQANPELMALDVDPNLLLRAQGIATQPGQGRTTLANSLTQRSDDRAVRTSGIFDAGMGPTPDVQAVLGQYQATTRTNAQAAYGAAFQNAQPVNVLPVVDEIDRVLRPSSTPRPYTPLEAELASVRDMVTGGGGAYVIDPRRLHEIQSNLRQTIVSLSASATGTDRNIARALIPVREALVGQIDDATGGAYRVAAAQYADDMAIQEAFDRGWTILDNPRNVEARPEYFRSWVGSLSQSELEAARLAARARFDTEIGSVRNAGARGSALPEVGFNMQRMRALFGDRAAEEMAERLNQERAMAASAAAILSGSQTAQRQQGAAATNVRAVGTAPVAATSGGGLLAAAFGLSGNIPAALGTLAVTGAGVGGRYLGRLSDVARNTRMAQMLSAQGADAQQIWGNWSTPLARSSGPLGVAQAGTLSGAQQVQPPQLVAPMLGRLIPSLPQTR